jgi:hypothetical protein
MSEAMQRRLTMVLCLRCSDVTVTLCDEELAFQLRISMDELAETKALFLRKGFIENDWSVCNWEKRQYASDSSAARTKAYRERNKNVTVTSHVTKSDALDTDTDTDTYTEKKKEQKGGKPPAVTLPDWLPESTWADWHAFRNQRKGWTHKARELSLATLTKLRSKGHDPTAVIEQSIERGWTGLFEIKTNTGNHNANIQQGRKLSAVEQVEQAIRNRRQREADNEAGPVAAIGYGRTMDEDGEPLRAHLG